MTQETNVPRTDDSTVADEDSSESSDHSSESVSEPKCSKSNQNGSQQKSKPVTIHFMRKEAKATVIPLTAKKSNSRKDQVEHMSGDEDDGEGSDSENHRPVTNGSPITDNHENSWKDFSVEQARHAANEMKKRLEEDDPCEMLRSLCKKGEIAKLEEFLEERCETGIDIDYVSNDGWTCLHEIITHGCQFTAVARILLQHGAKVDTTDTNMDAPIHASLLYHNSENTKLLLEYKANLELTNSKGRKPIHNANDAESLELLLDHGADIDAKDGNGNSPLHYAIMAKDVDRIKLLLSRHCDVTAANDAGSTALHLASDPEIVSMLLEAVSDDELSNTVNAMDANGNSPVHMAVRGRHRETVRQLISKRGKHDLLNYHGRSPISMAKDKLMKSILLKEEIADSASPSNTPTVKKVKSVPPQSPLPEGPIVLPGNELLQSPSLLKRKRHECTNGECERTGKELRWSEVNDYSGVESVQPPAKRNRGAAPLYNDFSSDGETD